MRRMTIVAALALGLSPAAAQIYNPAMPAVPPPILPPTPPAATPGMEAPPPLIGESSRTSQHTVPRGMGVGSPARETHNDRAIRCAHQAAAVGVPAGASGQYVQQCVTY